MAGEYTQDLADIKTLLQYQNDYIDELKAQAVLDAEAQAALKEELAAKEAATNEVTETSIEALNSISDNTKLTTDQLLSTNEQIATLETAIINLKEDQLHTQKTIVEGIWILAVVIALAVGMKLFWDNTLKW